MSLQPPCFVLLILSCPPLSVPACADAAEGGPCMYCCMSNVWHCIFVHKVQVARAHKAAQMMNAVWCLSVAVLSCPVYTLSCLLLSVLCLPGSALPALLFTPHSCHRRFVPRLPTSATYIPCLLVSYHPEERGFARSNYLICTHTATAVHHGVAYKIVVVKNGRKIPFGPRRSLGSRSPQPLLLQLWR